MGQCCPHVPGDASKLIELAQEYGEETVAVAWAIFILEGEGVVWHTEPVTVAVEKTGRYGKYVQAAENGNAVTKFPLRAFFKVADGYLEAAESRMADPDFKKVKAVRMYSILGDVNSPIVTSHSFEDTVWSLVADAMGIRPVPAK